MQILAVCLQACYLTSGPQDPLILCPKVRLKLTVIKPSVPGQLKIHFLCLLLGPGPGLCPHGDSAGQGQCLTWDRIRMNQPEFPGSGLDNIICLETWPLGGIGTIFWNLLSTGSDGPFSWELYFSQRILGYSQHSNALSGLGDKA